jgi:AraC-like DNA-binding protein
MSVVEQLLDPLAGHEVLDTTDVDQARLVTGRIIRDHRLLPEAGVFRAVLRSVALGGISLNYVDYRAGVRIITTTASNGVLVHIPLAGRADVRCGNDIVTSDPTTAVVIDPAERLDMTWAGGTPQLIVGLDRARLESHLGRALGRRPDRPLRFALGMDLNSTAVRSWLGAVALLVHEVADGPPVAMDHLESLIFHRFLLAQPNTYSSSLHEERPVASKAVRKAMALIENHAAEPLTVEDVAEAVGVGIRALQEGFRRYADTTPMSYLRDVRLRRVRAELAAAGPGTVTVTDVAVRWGFLHAGRFSVLYREQFGEKPSTTLHR